MIGKLIKKFLGKSDKDSKPSGVASFAASIKDRSNRFLGFLGQKYEDAFGEFLSIREKMNNLQETNYKLGLKHIEKGNIGEAIFRFRFMKKFWPNYFDAYYQLAYCFVLDGRGYRAKRVLEELLVKKPDYDPRAKELLDQIIAKENA